MMRWLVQALAVLALAPHRALIVGVGGHQDASMNLPRTGLDTTMLRVAEVGAKKAEETTREKFAEAWKKQR